MPAMKYIGTTKKTTSQSRPGASRQYGIRRRRTELMVRLAPDDQPAADRQPLSRVSTVSNASVTVCSSSGDGLDRAVRR